MPLFQKTILKKYKRSLDAEKLENQWKLFTTHFHDTVVQQNIRNSKEEQYQEGFVNDLFVKVLGYVKNPAPNYNFITEQKNEGNSKKADGAIIINEKIRAVVELKGCSTTDLGKVEAQAFGYKSRQPGCDYVVVSNFEKLRFYVENAVEHIEFNLFQLSKEDFKLLWLCLSYDSIATDLPVKLKKESLSTEDTITKKLYQDYSIFRRELFNDLLLKNPETDKLLLFKKTQKLLDRFLFILFAEDRLLLPVNLIKKIIAEWEQLREMRVEHSLYERFKLYFNDLNAGNVKQDIFAYNGGLFQSDEILDNLRVDDQLLHDHTHKLSTYDFESEVDVNILGHIFENSLNEIEEIENQVVQAPPGLPQGEEFV
ncbi:MAG TPA: type IIL restriction-modification enzyme MmeI, partial [Flavobacteriaceae bacterium]|nr:type IIL restriction-modification enzyme MmeI [Flavobacteriaceae bacterium]